MRDKSIDEFQAIFERASIPVLDIRELRLARAAVALKGDSLDASALAVAAYLRRRFQTQIRAYWSASAARSATLEAARGAGCDVHPRGFGSTEELVGQISIERGLQLVILPEPPDDARRVVDLDPVVEAAPPPILLIRRPVEDPSAVFRRILHSLSGNFRQTRNSEYSFSLVEDGGHVLLLHTIDESDLAGVREALQLTPDADDEDRAALLERLARRGERYLKAVVAASRASPYDVQYRLATGSVVEQVKAELRANPYGLLVIGCHEGGVSRVSASDYQLMHEVRDVAVLAL
ncbi:MAG: hypothetical protein C4547_12475 [Phycisphaerales bacterium]|nr:MAG: hypothetical protein C4547_12475 [Phycisphaerales bacterium]